MTASSSFPTYLWHYVVARLVYDHLVVVLIVIAVVVLLATRRPR
jgi:hypothetical protein